MGKNNTGMAALRAGLPVISVCNIKNIKTKCKNIYPIWHPSLSYLNETTFDCLIYCVPVENLLKIELYECVVCSIAHSCYMLLLQAVCCADKLHCCPNGYTCDTAAGTCTMDAHSMSWKAVAVRHMDKVLSGDVVCPGREQKCDDGQTCCELASGSYGCCPYPRVLNIACS